jgi:hypothetical protein
MGNNAIGIPGMHGFAAGLATGFAHQSNGLQGRDIVYSAGVSQPGFAGGGRALSLEDLYAFTEVAGPTLTLGPQSRRVIDLNGNGRPDNPEMATLFAVVDSMDGSSPDGRITANGMEMMSQFMAVDPLRARDYMGQVAASLGTMTGYRQYMEMSAQSPDIVQAKRSLWNMAGFFGSLSGRPRQSSALPSDFNGLNDSILSSQPSGFGGNFNIAASGGFGGGFASNGPAGFGGGGFPSNVPSGFGSSFGSAGFGGGGFSPNVPSGFGSSFGSAGFGGGGFPSNVPSGFGSSFGSAGFGGGGFPSNVPSGFGSSFGSAGFGGDFNIASPAGGPGGLSSSVPPDFDNPFNTIPASPYVDGFPGFGGSGYAGQGGNDFWAGGFGGGTETNLGVGTPGVPPYGNSPFPAPTPFPPMFGDRPIGFGGINRPSSPGSGSPISTPAGGIGPRDVLSAFVTLLSYMLNHMPNQGGSNGPQSQGRPLQQPFSIGF